MSKTGKGSRYEVQGVRNIEPRTSNFGSRLSHASRATACDAGGAKKRLEQSPVEGVPLEEKLRVPLDTEKEGVRGGFDRLHDAIGGHRAGDQ